MTRVPVTKMHGACNDFVVLDARRTCALDLVALARDICNRHSGIGADGLLIIESSNSADVKMRVINADGSDALMCGNGIRCIARYLDELGEGATLRIETASGMIATQIVSREPSYVVRAEMGTPRVGRLDDETPLDAYVEIGNVHAVLFRDEINAIDLPALGEQFQRGARFSNGINVHIAVLAGNNTLRARHYEHGAGLTMACGTGAVACAAAALENGSVTSPVEVLVPGGRLTVEWNGVGSAYLTGPAQRVFDTTFAVMQ